MQNPKKNTGVNAMQNLALVQTHAHATCLDLLVGSKPKFEQAPEPNSMILKEIQIRLDPLLPARLPGALSQATTVRSS